MDTSYFITWLAQYLFQKLLILVTISFSVWSLEDITYPRYIYWSTYCIVELFISTTYFWRTVIFVLSMFIGRPTAALCFPSSVNIIYKFDADTQSRIRSSTNRRWLNFSSLIFCPIVQSKFLTWVALCNTSGNLKFFSFSFCSHSCCWFFILFSKNPDVFQFYILWV